MFTKINLLIFILFLSNPSFGFEGKYFTGNPKVDLFTENLAFNSKGFIQSEAENIQVKKTKSPLLAGGMSLLIPGAGEFYAGSYIKSGLFLAVEAGAWIYYFKYQKKGDDQTNFFQNYADGRTNLKPAWDVNEPDRYRTRWDVIRYYEWSYANKSIINPQGDYSNISYAITNNDISLPPWERIDWDRLNELERAIGKWYSHTLHKHGEQQYYELIGKYPQYNQGWFDADDPNYTYGDKISNAFKEYSKMRGIANDYYYKAKTAATVALVNHVISAFDAYFTVLSYNRKIKLEANYKEQSTIFGTVPITYGTLKIEF